jgi:hypothetical protein
MDGRSLDSSDLPLRGQFGDHAKRGTQPVRALQRSPYLRKQLERWRHAVLARLGVSVMRSRRKADGELYDGKLSRTVRRAETHL